MYVACSGRCVEYEVVEVAPIGIGYELLQGIGCHSAAPQCCGVGIDEESDREHLDAIFLNWLNEVASVFLHGIRTCVLYLEHLRYRRTEDVAVEQSYLVTQSCQCYGEVGGYGTLAYSTLARAYCYDVLDIGQHLAYLGTWL